MPYKDPAKQAEARKRSREKKKAEDGERFRCWMLIFYPDSAPADWPDLLSDLHLPIWVSPLHDRDAWTAADERTDPKRKEGTPKKPHYHLVAQYPEKVSRKQFLDDFGCLNGPENVKVPKSLISMVRYLPHLDDPDKAQYNREDVRTFGGADAGLMDEMGTHERHEALKAMRKHIRTHNILYFDEFYDYCDDCEIRWAHLLDDSCTYVIREYIKARAYRVEQERKQFEYESGRRGYGLQGHSRLQAGGASGVSAKDGEPDTAGPEV